MQNKLQITFLKLFPLIMKVYHAIAPRIEVTKQLYGFKYVLNTNDHISFLVSPFDWEPHIQKVITQNWGIIWDVGSNFGLFSILAEKAGNNVIAFDPSKLAIDALNKTIRLNNCKNLRTVNKPLTSEKVHFKPIEDASCTNTMIAVENPNNSIESITYKEAVSFFGQPSLIKLDIEGGEKDLLEHQDFLQWVDENHITLLVELHNGYTPHRLQQHRVEVLSSQHILYRPSRLG